MIWLILVCLACAVSCSEPVVESPAGSFKGHVLKTRNGRDVFSYQGIPYAVPPVGNLRFKDPVKQPKLMELHEAKDDSHECYQPDFDLLNLKNMDKFKGSEDCLYLNVYVPKLEKEEGKLPVFVWIHGGGYYMASKSTFHNGPEYLLDTDMILVTINYRLAVLGFLSTGDDILPGNLGLKDQQLALKWVKENIESFGGDANLITIGGESAGGASIVQQMHAKNNKGLFQRAIAQSGTIDCVWSTKTKQQARATAHHFSSKIECPINSEFVECLQKKSLEQLFQATIEIKNPRNVLHMDFVPVIEDDSPNAILTESSIKQPSEIPLLMGITNRESLIMPFLMTVVNPKYASLSKVKDDFSEVIPVLTYINDHPDSTKIADKLYEFYFGKDGITDDSYSEIVNLIGDLMVNYPVYQRGQKHQGKSYMYMLSYKGQVNKNVFHPKGMQDQVGHSEDLLFLFNFSFLPHGPMNRRDREISNVIVNSWYNFVKYGDPTPENKYWSESENGTKYLDITNHGLIMRSNMFQERMHFLDTINFDTRTSFKHDEL